MTESLPTNGTSRRVRITEKSFSPPRRLTFQSLNFAQVLFILTSAVTLPPGYTPLLMFAYLEAKSSNVQPDHSLSSTVLERKAVSVFRAHSLIPSDLLWGIGVGVYFHGWNYVICRRSHSRLMMGPRWAHIAAEFSVWALGRRATRLLHTVRITLLSIAGNFWCPGSWTSFLKHNRSKRVWMPTLKNTTYLFQF